MGKQTHLDSLVLAHAGNTRRNPVQRCNYGKEPENRTGNYVELSKDRGLLSSLASLLFGVYSPRRSHGPSKEIPCGFRHSIYMLDRNGRRPEPLSGLCNQGFFSGFLLDGRFSTLHRNLSFVQDVLVASAYDSPTVLRGALRNTFALALGFVRVSVSSVHGFFVLQLLGLYKAWRVYSNVVTKRLQGETLWQA